MARSLPQVVRVRVDLREIKIEEPFQQSQFIWVAVDLTLLKSIEDFKTLLYQKFHIEKSKNIRLYLQQCLLPPDETILLLRDDDLVKIVYDDVAFLPEQQISTFNVENTATSSEKKKKKKHREKSLDASFEIPKKKRSHDSESIINSEKAFVDKPVTYSSTVIHSEWCRSDVEIIKDDKSLNETVEFENSDIQEQKICLKEKKHHKLHKISLEKGNVGLNLTVKEAASNEESHLKSENSLQSSKSESEDTSNLPNKANEEKQKNNSHQLSKFSKKRKRSSRSRASSSKQNMQKIFSVGSCLANLSNYLVPNKTHILDAKVVNSKEDMYLNCSRPKNKHIRFKEDTENCEGSLIKFYESENNEQNLRFNSYVKEQKAVVNSSNTIEKEQKTLVTTNGKEQKTLVTTNEKEQKTLVTTNEKEQKTLASTSEKEQKTPLAHNTKETVPLWMIWENPQCQAFDSYGIEPISHSTPSTKVQNSENYDHRPPEKKNYQQFPTMHSPPTSGDVIAYKVLELSECYCPEVSDYKEGKVICYNSQNDTVDIEIIQDIKKPQLGKFGDIHENGNESLTQVSLSWPALIEPRLLSS